ncbi:YicC family protein, partial [bacterium]|nr:YicC family protein [bacterium]
FMIFSMTGFGKAEKIIDGTTIAIEVRTLNSRYLDLVFKAPRAFLYKENEIKEFIKRKIERGKITLTLTIESSNLLLTNFTLDQNLVKQYTAMLREASSKAGLSGEVTLDHVLKFSDVFMSNANGETDDALWKAVLACVDQALDELNVMRRAEGAEMAKDLLSRLKEIESNLDKIEALSKTAVPEELEKLRERIKKLLEKTDFDPQRLEMELAVIADKVDITEELVRFRSHNKMFADLINGKQQQIGRKLNFITQEMGRETNTMGSKSSQSDVIHTVVAIKEELEKLREQIQNVE